VVIPRVCSICFYPFSHLSYFPIVVLHHKALVIDGQNKKVMQTIWKNKSMSLTLMKSKTDEECERNSNQLSCVQAKINSNKAL
jgi:hypothetical protein